MSFIKDNLMPNENILYIARFHWMIFHFTIILFLLALICYGTGDANIANKLLMVAILKGTHSVIIYVTSEFAVTNKRVLGKFGVIRRRSMDILLPKVESVQVNQGIFGRIFGYGSVIVRGSGGTPNIFPKISKPFELRNQVQMAASGQGEAVDFFGQQAPVPSPSAPIPGSVFIRWRLYGLSGPLAGNAIDITSTPIVIGRDQKYCNVIIPSSIGIISRKHCIIRLSEDGANLLIEDCGSKNGTFLQNGTKLNPGIPYQLRNSDRFYLSTPDYSFEIQQR